MTGPLVKVRNPSPDRYSAADWRERPHEVMADALREMGASRDAAREVARDGSEMYLRQREARTTPTPVGTIDTTEREIPLALYHV
jgi:hypothetical protein